MRVLLLVNPEAHGGRVRRLIPALKDFFLAYIPQFEWYMPTSAEDLQKTAQQAAATGYDRLFVAGGDGTAHAAINGLYGSSMALGIIPTGNGNDLSLSLGIPRDPIAAVHFLLQAPVGEMDVVRAGNVVYAGVAGVGFDAAVNRRANSWPGWLQGHLRYWLAGFLTKPAYAPQRYELVIDSEEHRGEALWISFANTPRYGGGLRVAPQARFDDGLLDVCLVEPMSFTQLLDLYPAIYRGEHLTSPLVRTFRAREVVVRAPGGAELYGDGERLGETPVRLRVEPRALRVLRAPG